MKNTMLWSSEFEDNYKDEKEFICEYGDLVMTGRGYSDESMITSEDIAEEFDYMNSIDYDVVKDMLVHHDRDVRDDGYFFVKADCGRWDGRHEGGRVIGSMLSVIERIVDFNLYQYGLKIEVIDDCLVITGHHHDSTDVFTIYQLTPKGQKWFDNQGYGADEDREVHQHLLNTKGYLRKPFFGKLGLDKWEG